MPEATTIHDPRLEGRVHDCRLEATSEGRVALGLAGSLPRGWSIRLARGLALQGASLQSGSALRGEGDLWTARFELEPGPAALQSQDCEAWVVGRAQAPPSSLPEPRILDFTMDTDPGGVLLEVHAWDGVGLLAAVLGQVWSQGLRLQRLAIETEAECAFQSMVLVDDALHAPSDAQCAALALSLNEITTA